MESGHPVAVRPRGLLSLCVRVSQPSLALVAGCWSGSVRSGLDETPSLLGGSTCPFGQSCGSPCGGDGKGSAAGGSGADGEFEGSWACPGSGRHPVNKGAASGQPGACVGRSFVDTANMRRESSVTLSFAPLLDPCGFGDGGMQQRFAEPTTCLSLPFARCSL